MYLRDGNLYHRNSFFHLLHDNDKMVMKRDQQTYSEIINVKAHNRVYCIQ